MTLYLTDHAVEQYVGRHRPNLGIDDARMELETIVQQAAPTKRRTLPGDAWIYLARTETGEAVVLAVRDGTVITVLPSDAVTSHDPTRLAPTAEQMEESQSTVAACRAMLDADPKVPPASPVEIRAAAIEASKRTNAEALLRAWRAGRHYSTKALQRAHERLGLTYIAVPAPATKPTPWRVTRVYRVERTMPDGSTDVLCHAETPAEATAMMVTANNQVAPEP
jgi:hypothetical protein